MLGGLLHVIYSNDFPSCHEDGDSIVYVDDDSDVVQHRDPLLLRDLIEKEARNSAGWLRDNRLCVSADKSKLLICGTKQLKAAREVPSMSIEVEGEIIEDSTSEKLLGVVLNNELTWKHHLYGDENNQGLVQQLSGRIGIMKLLKKSMSNEKLAYFANGIFYSKLNYCLAVFGNVFNLDKYKEEDNRYQSYTKTDNQRLQVLQNKLNRVLLNAADQTPTAELLEASGSMSIQQLIAYQTVVMAYKVMKTEKPVHLHQKLQSHRSGHSLRDRSEYMQQPSYKLSLSREGFLCRASNLMNMMNGTIRSEPELETFKVDAKNWIRENIAIKPVVKPNLISYRNRRRVNNDDQVAQPTLNLQNTITRYFQPINRS